MPRLSLFGVAMFWVFAVLPAAAGPELPAAAVTQCERLLNADAVRYVLRQIDLTEEQAANAEELIATAFPKEGEDPPANIDEILSFYKRLDHAKMTHQPEKVKRFSQRLQQLGQDVTGHAEFFSKLEPCLTDEQKKKLTWARARLERNPLGAVRPGDLVRLARDLSLSDEQQLELIGVARRTREVLGPGLRPPPKVRLEMISLCADELRALLTPAQLAKFEFRVLTLRSDLIDQGLRVTMPAAVRESSTEDKQP